MQTAFLPVLAAGWTTEHADPDANTIVTRLPLEIHLAIMWYMDMIMLLRWRMVCRTFRWLVEHELHALQERIICRFVPHPRRLLAAITSLRAVVTAESALAFFLRDTQVLCQDLEICVTTQEFTPLMEFLRTTYLLCPIANDDDTMNDWPPERSPYLFLICARTLAPPRRYLRIVKVDATTPLVGVMPLTNSAMMCAFNSDFMTCAYPVLTLRRCALVRQHGWVRPWRTEAAARRRNIRLLVQGFTLASRADELLPSYNAGSSNSSPDHERRWCTGHFGTCACVNRHFGDMHSLTTILHPDRPCWDYLVDAAAEEGPRMYTWTFPETGLECVGAHDFTDPNVEVVDAPLMGLFVSRVAFNLLPTFVGAHLLGCERRTWMNWSIPQSTTLGRFTSRLDMAWWEAGQGFVGPLRHDVEYHLE